MSRVERSPDPRKPDGPGRVVTEALLGISAPFVRQLVAALMLIALIVAVLPLAIVVFIVTSLLFYVVLMLLGTPTGTFGAVLGLTWFGGSLALIGWLCVLAWRRVELIRVLARIASPALGDEPAPTIALNVRDPDADSETVHARIAAADARLASSADDAAEDEIEPTSTGR